jgi:hypothetical protein
LHEDIAKLFCWLAVAPMVGDSKPADQTSTNSINAIAFAPTTLIYGDEPQRMTQLREGATKNVDLAVSKRFNLTERSKPNFVLSS